MKTIIKILLCLCLAKYLLKTDHKIFKKVDFVQQIHDGEEKIEDYLETAETNQSLAPKSRDKSKDEEFMYLKRLIIYTEGYTPKAYKDGTYRIKGKRVQNWSVGYGSHAGIGRIEVPKVESPKHAWLIASRHLDTLAAKARKEFPLLKRHQHFAIASLYYKAGEFIFDLPKSDKRYESSMLIKSYLKKGTLPARKDIQWHWIRLKNNVGNHKETRLLELDLLYKEPATFYASLNKLLKETKRI